MSSISGALRFAAELDGGPTRERTRPASTPPFASRQGISRASKRGASGGDRSRSRVSLGISGARACLGWPDRDAPDISVAQFYPSDNCVSRRITKPRRSRSLFVMNRHRLAFRDGLGDANLDVHPEKRGRRADEGPPEGEGMAVIPRDGDSNQ